MKFTFAEKDAEAIDKKIMAALGGRELGKMVQFEMQANKLVVTISKLGTSTLVFKQTKKQGQVQFSLSEEKIAFAHKVFKDEVKEKLCKIVEQVGGKVEA